jgi:hypothetical protein
VRRDLLGMGHNVPKTGHNVPQKLTIVTRALELVKTRADRKGQRDAMQ